MAQFCGVTEFLLRLISRIVILSRSSPAETSIKMLSGVDSIGRTTIKPIALKIRNIYGFADKLPLQEAFVRASESVHFKPSHWQWTGAGLAAAVRQVN